MRPQRNGSNEQTISGKEGPTDILHIFILFNELTASDVAGDLSLSRKIQLYAEDAGETDKEQLRYIIIRGLTHLMGYDHENENDCRRWKIKKKFKKLLK